MVIKNLNFKNRFLSKKSQMSQTEITIMMILIIILILFGLGIFFSKAKLFKDLLLPS